MFSKLCLSATTIAACFLSVHASAADRLDEVVVTASRTEQPISEVIGSVTVITREQIEQRQVQSLQDLLRGELGVDIANNGGLGKQSSMFMRGANSSQTLFLIDGVRLGSASAGITSFEFIPVDQIERIEIVRGPRSSLYGSDAIGGVIQIFTRKNEGVQASMSTGTYATHDFNAGFGMQQDKVRFSVHGNYIQSEGFDACRGSLSSGCFTVEPDKDGFHNRSVSASLGYAFGKFADLELNTLYAQGLTRYDGSFQNETRFLNNAPNLKLRITPVDALNLTFSGGITQDKSDNFKDSVFASRFNSEKRNAGAQIDWRMDQQQFTLGTDYLKDIVDSDTSFTNTERNNTGIYAQYLGKLGTHELSASARRDDNEQFGQHTTGNLGWKWFALERSLALNAGWGQAFHAPAFNDLYYPFGYGNPELKPERSQSYELGASGDFNWLNWSLQAYSTRVTDLIAYNTAFLPDNISKARLQGAELSLNGQWNRLGVGLNYTAQDPRNRQTGSNYDRILARRARQSGRVNLSYELGKALFSTSINVVGPRFDDAANTSRMGGYTTVDLLANIPLASGFALQVKVGNLLDRQYETAQYYNQAGRSVFVKLGYQPAK